MAYMVIFHASIVRLDPSISRFRPALLSWVFIPCDIVSLALQAGGGATSSTSTGSNQVGVNVSLCGLALQVFTLLVFLLVSSDYLIRFRRSAQRPIVKPHLKLFLAFLAAAIILILIRCIYRIGELSEGYSGALFHNEPVFYGLESV